LTLAGRLIVPPAVTVTAAAALPNDSVDAVIVVEPTLTPVTGTLTLLAPVVNITVAGTVAAAVLLEFSMTVRPGADAGVIRFNVRF
jgi:hypothetical protein